MNTPDAGFTATATVTDPTTQAVTFVLAANDHAASAREARNLDTPEAHRLAGRFREEERLCLQRAKILAEIAQAQALGSIADSLARIALAS
jgi:hypothetical protein